MSLMKLVRMKLVTYIELCVNYANDNTHCHRDVCAVIASSISDASQVFRPGSSQYALDLEHFALSAEQNSSCSVEPGSAQDVSTILQILGNTRTKFAVIKSGGHNLNPKFSSTPRVQISMARFNQLQFDAQASTVEVGSGMIWDDVYEQLQAYNVSVVGARATGIGIGGYIVAGGGYSYKTNQHGLASDNVVAMEVVLPDGEIKTVVGSRLVDRDLFFALRGGGNNFGIVTKFTLKTYPQTEVWGGSIIYSGTEFASVSAAVLNYTSNNKDIKTGIQCTFATLQGQILKDIIMANLFYDAPAPAPGIFDSFLLIPSISSDIGAHSYLSLIQSANTNLTAGVRFLFGCLHAIHACTKFYGSMLQSNSLLLNGYVIEPFLPEAESSDSIMLDAARQTAASLQQIASSNGILASAKYPNYAIFGTPIGDLYGENADWLHHIKNLVDPFNVMGLTGGFKFE
ncbi:FAD-binding domain-containing protein [Lentinula aff. detonsa]|nr:FAD-binding domain-containing protein [Lentinula aff. detonsa]